MPDTHSSRVGLAQPRLPLKRKPITTATADIDAAAARLWAAIDKQFQKYNGAYWTRADAQFGKLLLDSFGAVLPAGENYYSFLQGHKITPAMLITLGAEIGTRKGDLFKKIESAAYAEVLIPTVETTFLQPLFCGASQPGIDAVHALVLEHDWLYVGPARRTLDAARRVLTTKDFDSYRSMLVALSRQDRRRCA